MQKKKKKQRIVKHYEFENLNNRISLLFLPIVLEI